MDDAARIPILLASRPEPDSCSSTDTAATKGRNQIAHFRLDSQSAKGCSTFQGVRVFRDFISPSEADELIRTIEKAEFTKAQSGKLKQHYGPKINFNKKKMNADAFQGLPSYAFLIEDRLRKLAAQAPDGHTTEEDGLTAALDAFETTDVFVLRYIERDESNLDFHRDDAFAYGELILDLSLESDSVLTFLRQSPTESDQSITECVRVPLPARSVAAVYGQARFDWEHAVLAYDIEGQRTSVTLRTLSDNLRRSDAGQSVTLSARRSRTST